MTERNYDDLKERVNEIIKNGDSYIPMNTSKESLCGDDLLKADFGMLASATSLQKAAMAISAMKEAKQDMEKVGGYYGIVLFMKLFAGILEED